MCDHDVAKELQASGMDDASNSQLLSILVDLFNRDVGPPKKKTIKWSIVSTVRMSANV